MEKLKVSHVSSQFDPISCAMGTQVNIGIGMYRDSRPVLMISYTVVELPSSGTTESAAWWFSHCPRDDYSNPHDDIYIMQDDNYDDGNPQTYDEMEDDDVIYVKN